MQLTFTQHLLPFILFLGFHSIAHTQCWEWAQCVGQDLPPSSAEVYIHHMDTDGNSIFLAGYNTSANSVFLDGNEINVGSFIMKLGLEDRIESVFNISESQGNIEKLKIDDAGNIYLFGEIEDTFSMAGYELYPDSISNYYLLKLNNNGQADWMQSYNYPDFIYQNDFDFNSSGEIFLIGSILDVSTLDVLLTKLDNQGNETWTQNFGGTKNQFGDLIHIDQNDDIIIRGEFDDLITVDTAMASGEGNSNDMFLLKLNSIGELQWLKSAESDVFSGVGLTCDAQNNIYLSGTYQGDLVLDDQLTLTGNSSNYESFVAKYSSDGDPEWAEKVGGADNEEDIDLLVDANDNINLLLSYDEAVNFNSEIINGPETNGVLICRFSPAGSPLDYISIADENEAYPDGGLVDFNNRIYTSGYFNQLKVLDQIFLNGSFTSGFIAKANFISCDEKLFASCDATQTNKETSVTIAALDNDFTPIPINVYEIVLPAANGTALMMGNDSIQYIPGLGFEGVDHFKYRICDDFNCDTAFISVNVVNYIPGTLAEVTADINGDYYPDSLGSYATIEGTVYGGDMREGFNEPGVKFTLINEDNTAGILIYSEHDFHTYQAFESDGVRVLGRIFQHNGMTSIAPDQIVKVSENNPLVEPEIITHVNEAHENRLIKFEQKMWLEDTTEWVDDWVYGVTIDITDGNLVWDMRVDDDVTVTEWMTPPDTFYITGLGYQRDHTPPYDTCHRIFPRYMEDFELIFPDAIHTPDPEIDVKVFPNPACDFLILEMEERIESISLHNMNGQQLSAIKNPDPIEILKTTHLSPGIYFIYFKNDKGTRIEKVMIE